MAPQGAGDSDAGGQCAIQSLADIVDCLHLEHGVLQAVDIAHTDNGDTVMPLVAAQEFQRAVRSHANVVRQLETERAGIEAVVRLQILDEDVHMADTEVPGDELLAADRRVEFIVLDRAVVELQRVSRRVAQVGDSGDRARESLFLSADADIDTGGGELLH